MFTGLQSRSFLKNIENCLCMQKLVINHSIPSMHAKKKNYRLFSQTLFYSISLSQPLWMDREMNTLAVRGLEEHFSSCAVVSVFGSGGKQVLVLHTYVLRVQYSCGVVLVIWFWWEIVFDITYVLSVQYSCVVVSVFWLWRGISLKMQTRQVIEKIKLSSLSIVHHPKAQEFPHLVLIVESGQVSTVTRVFDLQYIIIISSRQYITLYQVFIPSSWFRGVPTAEEFPHSGNSQDRQVR